MALDRFPCAPRGDPHLLVVVAARAAGGERVAKPEPVVAPRPRWRCRRTSPCPCRRRRPDTGRPRRSGRPDPAATTSPSTMLSVRSSRPREERLVARDRLLHAAPRDRPRAGGRLTTNPPLEPTGTISAFLTICAFIRPRTSVRKSSRRSDQRKPPRATLPPRRCTPSTRGEYTKISNRGRGSGRIGTCDGSSLNDRYRGERAALVAPEEVRAQDRLHDRQEAAQDPVLVEALDGVDRLLDLARRAARPRRRRARRGRSAPRTADEQDRDLRVADQRALHVGVRERDPGLTQILGDRPHDRDLAAGEAGRSTSPLSPSSSSSPAPDAEERLLEEVAHPLEVLGRARAGRSRRSTAGSRSPGVIS